MKTKYKTLLIIPVLVSVLIVVFKQYEEKKLYEDYISLQINGKVQKLVNSIYRSLDIYEEILHTGELTKRDASTISIYSRNLLSIPQDLHSVGIELNRIEPGSRSTTENIAKTAQSIGPFFSGMIGYDHLEMEELDDVLYSLEKDPSMRIKIEHLHGLYELWVNVVKENLNLNEDGTRPEDAWRQYEEINVKDKGWVNLVLELDKVTQEYFPIMKSFLLMKY